jgi:hypothetical protein
MAERGRFELPIGLPLCRISSAVHSTTLPPLREMRVHVSRLVGGRDSMRLGLRQAHSHNSKAVKNLSHFLSPCGRKCRPNGRRMGENLKSIFEDAVSPHPTRFRGPSFEIKNAFRI